tara:strand:- start:10615 stop:11010 length:396 start_codon:yes stop_codon:yes gene_type:complete
MAISNKNKDLLSLMKNNIAQKLENQARESVRTGFLKYEGSEKIRKKIITTKNSENLTPEERLAKVKDDKLSKNEKGEYEDVRKLILHYVFKMVYLFSVSFFFAFSVLEFGDTVINAFQELLYDILSSIIKR